MRRGRTTPTLDRSGRDERAPCYVSLVAHDRTLDLELADEDSRDLLYDAMRSVIEAGLAPARLKGTSGALPIDRPENHSLNGNRLELKREPPRV